jgi:tRNA(Ile)-lysidine synthase
MTGERPMQRDVGKIFIGTVRGKRLLPEGATVWAAVSGGCDSVLMLRLLHGYSGLMAWKLGVLHIDHRARPGSGQDAGFVERLAGELGLPFELRRLDPPGGSSPEAVFSSMRLGIYRETAGETGLVAVGHTASDRAETVILRLMEGSGLRGLGGMDYRGEGPVRRPMLDLTREDVQAKLREMGQAWVEDPTNESSRFLRNRIRSLILPAIEEVSPGSTIAFARSASILSGWRDVADGAAEALVQGMMDEGAMAVSEYASLSPVLRLGLLWAVSGRPRGGRTELEKADRWLCRGGRGRHPLPGGSVLQSDGNRASVEEPRGADGTEMS